MKGIVGIYVGGLYFPPEKMHKWDERNLYSGGIGGSEIWAIEIANKFEEDGYHCIVFADCERWHYSEKGVEYIPFNEFDDVCRYTEFKCFITSRKTYMLSENIKAEKIILMLHDPFVLFADNNDELKIKFIDKITYQSEFQKRLLREKYNVMTDEMFFQTYQAIHPEYYTNVDNIEKKNQMVWSTHKIRGARLLIEKILPKIRKFIPDFEIHVCGYADDMNDEYFKNDGVVVHGNVSKEELIQLQMESKIWIYPNWGMFEDGRINDETFCITAIENGVAKNALILADRTCFSSTLKGYSGFVGTELFNGQDIIPQENIEKFTDELAHEAIILLSDEEERKRLANESYEICKQYTWERAYQSFKNEIEEIVDENEERIPLILLTGVLRSENLDKILVSIKENLLHDKRLQVTWVICADKYNIHGSLEGIKQKCIDCQKEYQSFGWCISPVGKEGKKNYGGTLFNMPLIWVKENWFNDKNPWVYILDDDNIINPLLGEIMYTALNNANKLHKNIVYTNILYENGNMAPLCYNTMKALLDTKGYVAHYQVIDPSQIILKYSFLKEIGFYTNNMKYDEDIWKILMHRDIDKDILFPVEYGLGNDLNKIQTTHNAISSKEDIETWVKIAKDKRKKKYCTISICTNQEGSRCFHISDNDALEVMEKLMGE